MKETELKPCPFCGGEAKLIISTSTKWFSDDEKTIYFKVRCNSEDASCIGTSVNHWEYTKERAVESWNRRAYERKAD
jgi:Lar family restriction alleviation protein